MGESRSARGPRRRPRGPGARAPVRGALRGRAAPGTRKVGAARGKPRGTGRRPLDAANLLWGPAAVRGPSRQLPASPIAMMAVAPVARARKYAALSANAACRPGGAAHILPRRRRPRSQRSQRAPGRRGRHPSRRGRQMHPGARPEASHPLATTRDPLRLVRAMHGWRRGRGAEPGFVRVRSANVPAP